MEDGYKQRLIQRIAELDDQQAFKELFWQYYDRLLYFSNSFIKCKEVAEEIVEDVFVSVWNKRTKLPAISNLQTYLYVAVKNLSLNYLQRRGYSFENLDQLDVSLISFSPTPEHIIVATEMLQAINKAISELPPRCRIVYKLVKEDGLRYKEVAEILQISPRTVENHLATALRKIANEINVDLKTTSFHNKKASPSK